MAFSQSMPALVGTGLYFHLVSIMASKELGPEVAAMTLSVIGLCSFPATFIAGMILEKVTYMMIGLTAVAALFAILSPKPVKK